MLKIFYPVIGLFVGAAILFSGCGTRHSGKTDEIDIKETKDGIRYVTSLDQMEENHVYVLHDGKYQYTYFPHCTYDTSEEASSATDILWLMSDEEKVPTLYKGDQLIYYKTSALADDFILQRFYEQGYTIGISGLTELPNGRYSFDAVSDATNICGSSDAGRVKKLNEEKVIIDTVGGAPLRSGNIASGGVIKGLQKGEYYDVELYVGSVLKSYVIQADVDALTYSGSQNISDYTFLRSDVLRINIPSYYNTGYYSLPGLGLFRYVNGTAYAENTDYNIENVPPENESVESSSENFLSEDNAAESIPFILKKAGTVRVVIKYSDNSQSQQYMTAPVVKVIGPDETITLDEPDDGTFDQKLKLKEGKYTIEITGLNGRTYQYKVLSV